MRIVTSDLEAVAVRPTQYPEGNLAEIAFAGRSNVGKSSLLNLLTGRKKLARVSGSPGKTRTINFYRVNENDGPFRIVDLPGYGYAKVSKTVSESWGEMMETYLQGRENLLTVVQLVDIRHEPTAQDRAMHDYLVHYGLSHLIAATKADKVSRNQLNRQLAQIRRGLALTDERIFPVSALKKTGQQELLDAIEEILGR